MLTMGSPWQDFWRDYAETLGVTLAFATASSGFALWNHPNPTVRQGLSVIVAGVVVTAVATVVLHGYLAWSPLLAPLVGAVSGLVAMPVMFAVMRGGKRIEDRADDLTDAAIKRVTGKEAGQ